MTDEQEISHADARSHSNVGLGRQLTQPELDALPDGTEVVVTWGGGNGPHKYTISNRLGEVDIYGKYGEWIGTPQVGIDTVWLPNV